MSKRRRKKIPENTFTTSVSQLSHDGRGIAHINGKATFLFGALPDETVEFRYTQIRGSFDEGAVTHVIQSSPKRHEVKCSHFGVCGGCSLQHLTRDAQIDHKQSALLNLLKHQAQVEPKELLPPLVSSPWEYRRKARIGVKYVPKKNKVLVGFRERNSSFVTDIEQCHVLHPAIGKKIEAISNTLMQLEAREFIPQLEIAITDEQTAIIIRHLITLSEHDIAVLKQFAQQQHFTLYLQPKGVDSIHLLEPTAQNPLLQYHLPDHQLTLQFHPTQFTQINQSINEQMINQALTLLELDKNDTVLDLFCGIGNFTLPIARHCHAVVGVEGDQSAIDQARRNAIQNHIHNTEFYTADLFQDASQQPWFEQQYQKILLDPPRSGATEILAYLPKWQPNRVVYVSCNLATLARDAKIFIEHGYELQKAGVMDMFPHTQHVEAICLFIKK